MKSFVDQKVVLLTGGGWVDKLETNDWLQFGANQYFDENAATLCVTSNSVVNILMLKMTDTPENWSVHYNNNSKSSLIGRPIVN